jgi:hypothetical protein
MGSLIDVWTIMDPLVSGRAEKNPLGFLHPGDIFIESDDWE